MSETNRPFLAIVIPAYNEAARLPQSLQQIRKYCDSLAHTVEVLVMVERSSDNTLELARAAVNGDKRFHVIDNLVHRGKGYAVRCGMLRSTAHIVLFMDADLSTPLGEIAEFLRHFEANPGADLVIGSRALALSAVEKPQRFLRRNMGRIFNQFVKLFGVPDITDTQCGFKAFRFEAAQEIFKRQKLDGFAFDVEVLMLANALGYQIDVRPVRWANSRESKVNIVKDSFLMLRDLIRLRAQVRRTMIEAPIRDSAE